MNSFDPDASADELAASLGVRYPSPARARPRPQQTLNYDYKYDDSKSTPLANSSPNIKRKQLNLDVTPSLFRTRGFSPAKSMFFDPDPEQGGVDSPWRIKVTVQAEPRPGSSSAKSPAPRTRVVKVPLKGMDSPSPQKGLKRKLDADSAIKKRKGTPRRRRSERLSGDKSKLADTTMQEDTPAPEEQPVKRKRGRPRKSAPVEELVSTNTEEENIVPEAQEPEEEMEEFDPFADVEPASEDRDLQEEAAALTEDAMAPDEQDDNLPDGFEQDEDEDDVGFIHPNEQANEQTLYDGEQEPSSPQHSFVKAGAKQATRPIGNFDFSKLTPLHAKHNFPPQFGFSPLPPQQSPARSPAPFSKRKSSPMTEDDADMWRSQLSKPESRGSSHVHGGRARSASEYDDEEGLEDEEQEEDDEVEMPEATSRTIGEATMMESEDFSMVSLSSLPSARNADSSMLSQSVGDQSLLGRSVASERRKSRLGRAVTFSSPLVELARENEEAEEDESGDEESGFRIEEVDQAGRELGYASGEDYEDEHVEYPEEKAYDVEEHFDEEAHDMEDHFDEEANDTEDHSDDEASVGQPLPQKRKRQKSVTFSSPLAQSFQSPHRNLQQKLDNDKGGIKANEEIDNSRLPQKRTPQRPSLQRESSSHEYNLPSSVNSRPRHSSILASANKYIDRSERRVSLPRNLPGTQQTEAETRLPTPISGENTSSPSHLPPQSDVSYPELVDRPIYTESEIQNTLARSDADMSTPPATPPRYESPATKRVREASLLSSTSKRSHVDVPKSTRMMALENKWQEDRDKVLRTLKQAKTSVMLIESDDEESEDEEVEDKLMSDPVAEQTKDVWADISASYDEGESYLSRKARPTHARPVSRQAVRPAKIARTELRKSPSAIMPVVPAHGIKAATPKKTFAAEPFAAEENMASVRRREKSKADVAALFGQFRADVPHPSFIVHKDDSSPFKPSPLRQAYDGTFDETEDVSGLSDVRQLRREMKSQAPVARRPPFPARNGEKSETLRVPTKVRSVDDTVTTEGGDEDEQVGEQSVISFTGQKAPARPLFRTPKSQESFVKASLRSYANTRPIQTGLSAKEEGVLSSFWKTITFSQPYIPLPRPTHPTLANNEDAYPLLPSTWAWSHTHWQTLNTLYQYYKRKPSRFSPSRTSGPDNTGLLPPSSSWQLYTDITFEKWGYHVRLEDTHIVLAVLFSQLLVLPGAKEYKRLYGRELEYGLQDREERRGQKIEAWDVLVKVFCVVAGELLREDELVGRRVRREEVAFRYRLRGEGEWRDVVDEPVF